MPEVHPERKLRLPALRKLACGAIAVAFVAGMAFSVILRFARARCINFEEEVSALRSTARQVTRTTPCLATRQGNAWDEYTIADHALASLGYEEKVALSHCGWSRWGGVPTNSEREVAFRVVERETDVLRHLMAGTRSNSASIDISSHRSGAAEFPHTLQLAGSFLAVASQSRLKAGDVAGALELLADMLQFGDDCARIPRLCCLETGARILLSACDRIRSVLILSPEAVGDRRVIEKWLLVAEENLPSLQFYVSGELAWAIEDVLKLPRGGRVGGVPRRRLWRQLFSYDVALSEGVKEFLRWNAEMAGADGRPWELARATYPRIAEQAASTGNPFVHEIDWRVRYPERMPSQAESYRRLLATMRLLRAGLMALRGARPGDSGWPDDPFPQTPMRLRTEGSRILVWSEDFDGNAGGVGNWMRSTRTANEDLVLELLRAP